MHSILAVVDHRSEKVPVYECLPESTTVDNIHHRCLSRDCHDSELVLRIDTVVESNDLDELRCSVNLEVIPANLLRDCNPC